MSVNNYQEEITFLYRLLRTETFRFIIVRYNHYSLLQALKQDVKKKFPDRSVKEIDATKITYRELIDTYIELGSGFFFIENFRQILKDPELYAGLNQRRDKLAQYPIAIFALVEPPAERHFGREIMEKMPDLWSYRSLMMDLKKELTPCNQTFELTTQLRREGFFQPLPSTLGGNTQQEKETELARLEKQLSATPETEIPLRLTLFSQIAELQFETSAFDRTLQTLKAWEKVAGETDLPKIERIRKAIAEIRGEKKQSGGVFTPPRYLTQSPFKTDYFIGRDDDLERLHEAFVKENQSVIWIYADGGVGKTTLANQYYYKYQTEYQHLAWVFAELDVENALLSLAWMLEIRFDPMAEKKERLVILFDHLRQLPGPVLLVIDNASSRKGFEENEALFAQLINFHVLVTSREKPWAKALPYHLPPLPAEDAKALFQKYYPQYQVDEDEILNQMLQAVDYNTLVVEILAKNLRTFNRLRTDYSLEDLLLDLQKGGLFGFRAQKVGVSDPVGPLRKEDPKAILAKLYDLNPLEESHRQLLSIFSVLPAENIKTDLIKEVLPDRENLQTDLEMLASKGWLKEEEEINEYKMS
ncbi:MAG: hypothetical protein KDD99_13355, partial [Bacteroidetes bacterium]|nr:hypothetical protein [Bacteroidota bacterium]